MFDMDFKFEYVQEMLNTLGKCSKQLQMGIHSSQTGPQKVAAAQHVLARPAAISFVGGNQGQYQGLSGSHSMWICGSPA